MPRPRTSLGEFVNLIWGALGLILVVVGWKTGLIPWLAEDVLAPLFLGMVEWFLELSA